MRGGALAGLLLVGALSATETVRPGVLEAHPPDAMARSEAPETSRPEAESAVAPKPRAYLLYLDYDRDPLVIGDYREEEGQIVFEKYGGQIKIPRAQVLRIVPDQPGAPDAFPREPVRHFLQEGLARPRPRGPATHYLSLGSGGNLRVSEVRPEGDRLRVVTEEGSFTIPSTEVIAILRVSVEGEAHSEAWLLLTRGGKGPAPLPLAPPPIVATAPTPEPVMSRPARDEWPAPPPAPQPAVEPGPPMVASASVVPEPSSAQAPEPMPRSRAIAPEPAPAPTPIQPASPPPPEPVQTVAPTPPPPPAPSDQVVPPSPPPVRLAALPPSPPELPRVERSLPSVSSSDKPHLLEMASGETIRVKGFWIEDGQVKFRRFGGMVGIALSEVLKLVPEEPEPSGERVPVRLARLLGPTFLEVRVKGESRLVRLLGIDALAGLDRAREPWRGLERGDVLQLEFDREREAGGIWLAYVFLPSGRMLNAELVRLGLARPAVDGRALKYIDLFHELGGRPAQ